jgi:alanine-glyoxylate transaminase/serine-glyoxylate transaminase/serine-pyruvate transaminase
LREGLRIITEESLDMTFSRFRANATILWNGLGEIGIRPFIPLEYRLPSLTSVHVPQGVDPHKIRTELLNKYNIEIGAGFASLRDLVWRIGLMGYSSRRENITLLLAALNELMKIRSTI